MVRLATAVVYLLAATAGHAATFGADDRRPLTHAEQAAFAGVGLIVAADRSSLGTATLVGRCDAIVTAAHLVFDADGRSHDDTFFFHDGGRRDHRIAVDLNGAILGSARLAPDDIANDWIVLPLQRPVPGCAAAIPQAHPAAWFDDADAIVAVGFHPDVAGDWFAFAGAAMGFRWGRRGHAGCRFVAAPPAGPAHGAPVAYTDCDTNGSGTALFAETGGSFRLVGIFVADRSSGSNDQNGRTIDAASDDVNLAVPVVEGTRLAAALASLTASE